MLIEPKIRNNICLNAHPAGCLAEVRSQIEHARRKESLAGPKKVLIIGSSNGYGLAARIVSAVCSGADSIGIAYERPGTERRSASSGWYNNAAFKQEIEKGGLRAWNINGDAFSEEVKLQTASLIREELGRIDLLIYSIAAPRRKDPASGELHSSVIKPIGQPFESKTLDFQSGEIAAVRAEPADDEEIRQTIKVMGGEDWLLWIKHLLGAGLLAEAFKTAAFSYIGPELTYPIYRDGTIGRAKQDLEAKRGDINSLLGTEGGRAYISVNKALVTRASAVIPAVPLYISLLYRVMKEKGLHENCIGQMERLFFSRLYDKGEAPTDKDERIRLDDWEMRPDVQEEVQRLWRQADSGNIEEISDIEGFRKEFLRHHGFLVPGVDYEKDIDPRFLPAD